MLNFYTYEKLRPPLPPLPECEGPRLEPFSVEDDVDIEFISPIASGGHAVLWQVAIQGRVYALKMFKNLGPGGFPVSSLLGGSPRLPPKAVQTGQALAFHCECRAYGRLKETGCEDIAVRAHGYVLLTRTQREDVQSVATIDWDPDRYGVPEDYRVPAIVKDYVDPSFHFLPRMIPNMIRHMKKFHRVGILLHDVKKMNYLNGLFCDFSYAWTVPHFMMDDEHGPVSFDEVYDDAVYDFADFDHMIDVWNEEHPEQRIWRRLLPNQTYQEDKLRGGFRTDQWPLRWIPSDYDWKAAQAARNQHESAVRMKIRSPKTPEKPAQISNLAKPIRRSNRVQKKRPKAT